MRTWIEVDIDNLEYNINKIKELSNNRRIMAIVKADAYGVGAISISKELSKIGIDFFGVSSLDEAIELRENGIKEEILILYGLFNDEFQKAAASDFQVTLTNFSQIEYLVKNNIKVKAHIKVDTGMGRVGFFPKDARIALNMCKENEIDVVGIYTHLSDADDYTEESIKHTKNQIAAFKEFENLDDIKYKHILNTGGILKYSNETNSNIIRPGIMIYGVYGGGKIDGLKKVVTMKSRIMFLKKLEDDMDISYGRKEKGYKKDLIATIGAGYADGLKRNFSSKGTVEIHGVNCKIVGTICMDTIMVKIPEEIKEKVKIGDEVTIIGDDVYEKSKLIDTSVCEIFTGINRRVVKKYMKKNKSYTINTLLSNQYKEN